MTSYTRHQLLLILLVVAAAGAGLAIDHWRRARPDLVERLEHLDRAEPATAAPRDARRPPGPRGREGGARARRERDAADHTAREAARASREHRVRAHDERMREQADHDQPAGARRQPAPTPDSPLDLNQASAADLARLPGVGRTLAARIVEAQPFAALDDLARVRGLRAGTLARLRPLLAIAGADSAGARPAFPLPP